MRSKNLRIEESSVRNNRRTVCTHCADRDRSTTCRRCSFNVRHHRLNKHTVREEGCVTLNCRGSRQRGRSKGELDITSLTIRQVITHRVRGSFRRTVLNEQSVVVSPVSTNHVKLLMQELRRAQSG